MLFREDITYKNTPLLQLSSQNLFAIYDTRRSAQRLDLLMNKIILTQLFFENFRNFFNIDVVFVHPHKSNNITNN